MIKLSTENTKKFLITKNFIGLELETHKDKVIDLFGNPIQHEPQKGKNYEICSYGVLQVYLLNEVVAGFTFDYQKAHYYKNSFKYEPIDRGTILRYLDSHQVEYSENLLLQSDHGSSFDMENGISLGFVDNKLVIFGLIRIGEI